MRKKFNTRVEFHLLYGLHFGLTYPFITHSVQSAGSPLLEEFQLSAM